MAHEVKYTMAGKDNEIAVVGTMASLCPAWGMLGTLVGLVLLLQNLDDPSAIGPAMAVALITTFYGSLLRIPYLLLQKRSLKDIKLRKKY